MAKIERFRNSKSLKPKGRITICSNKDEVLKITATADYVTDGNHHCVISNSQKINSLLERIISLKRQV